MFSAAIAVSIILNARLSCLVASTAQNIPTHTLATINKVKSIITPLSHLIVYSCIQ